MHKSPVFWGIIGWLVSLLFPPSALFGAFRGVFGNA
ncbi:hypothetical protein EV192_111184 [Actinocrispum wychmicini]|uniref:Uncharacterized protein n=1 Tax=Actinocrispum wychmicini TaxID=1213861 RepID=A0A4V2S5Q1_9PSEU|nr:hypothetical protein EV192_111184 [Actinocrispum wychmicini]